MSLYNTAVHADVLSCKFNAGLSWNSCESTKNIALVVSHPSRAFKCPYSYAGGRRGRAVSRRRLLSSESAENKSARPAATRAVEMGRRRIEI